MREIQAYQSADGLLHADEKSAIARDDDIIGEELDGLLRLYKLELSRSQEHKGILTAMRQRSELLKACRLIVKTLEHSIYTDE